MTQKWQKDYWNKSLFKRFTILSLYEKESNVGS